MAVQPEPKTLFSVVIVTWNAERFIGPCLDSLRVQTLQDYEIILVDNGSKDRTVELARGIFAFKAEGRFRLIRNMENLGFCRANNQALRLCASPCVLILNSDVVLERHFLEHALDAIAKAPSGFGLFNPTILRPDGVTVDTLGLRLSRNRRFFNVCHLEPFDRDSRQREIFGPCGAAAIIRRETLEAVREGECGYFDPRFFFLAEDFDLAWKAGEQGWKSLYIPGPVCFHHGQCAAFKNRFRQYLSFRNRYFLIIKHEGAAALKRYLFMPYDVVRFLYLMAVSPRLTLRAVKEVRAFYREEKLERL